MMAQPMEFIRWKHVGDELIEDGKRVRSVPSTEHGLYIDCEIVSPPSSEGRKVTLAHSA